MQGTQAAPAAFAQDTLYVSANTIMFDSTAITEFNDSCQGDDQLTTAVSGTADVFTAMPSNPSENNKAADSVNFTPIGAAVDAANVEGPFSDFFDTVTYSGAFDPTAASWLDGWSYLDCVQGVLAGGSLDCTDPNAAVPTTFDTTMTCGDMTADLSISGNVLLPCQVFVKDGVTLTIAPGTVIYAETVASTYTAPATCDATACTAANSCIFTAADATAGTAASCAPFTSVLVVEKGGTINAAGTVAQPITFTAKATTAEMEATGSTTTVTDSTSGFEVTHGTRGNWGGLIILGKAPVTGGSRSVEGLAHDVPYGGIDPTDNSGTLQYVRVWHGGAAIAADNEINGITFGGVGTGTTVDHCEVALNVDDGFEFFGGTVNAKYLSTLYVGDDAFDTDKGYQGKMQYLLAMIGTQGNHGTEMDGNKGGQATFSAPQVQSMTVVGSNDNARSSELLRLREGTGGAFANIVLAKGNGGAVINHGVCDANGEDGIKVTQTPSSTGKAMLTEEYLYVAGSTVIQGASGAYTDSCGAGFQLSAAVASTAAVLQTVTDDSTELSTANIDLTPVGDAVAAGNVEAAYSPWFDTVTYSGAFAPGADSWLDGWSYLDCVQGVLAGGSLDCTDPNALANLPYNNCGGGTWQLGDCAAPPAPPCLVDEMVSSNACVDCPAGKTNTAGDDPTGADTTCTTVAEAAPPPPPTSAATTTVVAVGIAATAMVLHIV